MSVYQTPQADLRTHLANGFPPSALTILDVSSWQVDSLGDLHDEGCPKSSGNARGVTHGLLMSGSFNEVDATCLDIGSCELSTEFFLAAELEFAGGMTATLVSETNPREPSESISNALLKMSRVDEYLSSVKQHVVRDWLTAYQARLRADLASVMRRSLEVGTSVHAYACVNAAISLDSVGWDLIKAGKFTNPNLSLLGEQEILQLCLQKLHDEGETVREEVVRDLMSVGFIVKPGDEVEATRMANHVLSTWQEDCSEVSSNLALAYMLGSTRYARFLQEFIPDECVFEFSPARENKVVGLMPAALFTESHQPAGHGVLLNVPVVSLEPGSARDALLVQLSTCVELLSSGMVHPATLPRHPTSSRPKALSLVEAWELSGDILGLTPVPVKVKVPPVRDTGLSSAPSY